VIWVSPTETCDIYIDYKNGGVNRTKFANIRALSSNKFVDVDQDMSGALIFATKPGTGIGGAPVDIAAAWGQDPSVSRDMQSISMDLGTVVRPFPRVYATKSVDKPIAKPGEVLTYTIKVMNAGQVDLPGRSLIMLDKLDSMVSYVPGTAKITYNIGLGVVEAAVADDSVGKTKFPLDEAGYTVIVALPKRGGSLDFSFDVLINGPINAPVVINNGEVKQPFGENIKFDVSTDLVFDPKIALDNKVYLSSDVGESCGTAVEYVEDIVGAGVVYCFNVTNTGNTFLSNFTLEDFDLAYTNRSLPLLAPGNSTMITFRSKISKPLLNMANVSATPVFLTGVQIAGLPRVRASDPSKVGTIIPAPSISIDNKVALGDDSALCRSGDAVEFVQDFVDAPAMYCFNVTNTGNTYLASVAVDNKDVVFTNTSSGIMAPGESRMIAVPRSIAKTLKNIASVVANPVFKDGTDIPGLQDVTASDPSEVGILIVTPAVDIDNTVYLGREAGFCSTDKAKELAEGKKEDDVTFCFLVTNTGDSYLNITSVVDPILGYSESNLGILAPKESIAVSYPSKIGGNVTNSATVLATPVTPQGKVIPSLKDVTDSDPSEVRQANKDGTPNEFVKPDPAGNKTCMDNAYEDAFDISDALVCTSKEVYLENVDSKTPKTCERGQVINLDLSGSIRFNSARFDLGWYVATDGGDALDGSCVVNGLQQAAKYNVVERPGSTKIVGSVNWNDAKGTKDACGDIVMTAAGGGNIDTPIAMDLPVICADDDKDGRMDVAVCFTWRNADNDDVCTMNRNDPLTKGRLADMYPGATSGCYCERYTIPSVTVTTPPVKPC
jgi:uncharacterized repeat protein (TIGR01451 family)